ncbi:DUF3048 C-terminal domain-containing protein [Nonomuraea dietziae]|uniref:DUF3048 C-terminal domain-containing protein n=1 Tax=Nonomuraea dietziae TaxID=65515 RepID=UPI0031E15351
MEKKTWTVKWPAATFTFGWSETKKQWLIWQDGKKNMAAEGRAARRADDRPSSTPRPSAREFHDKNQSYTPLVHTVGKGSAIVLREGKAYKARWSRESEEDGTTFTTASGEPMNFAPRPGLGRARQPQACHSLTYKTRARP